MLGVFNKICPTRLARNSLTERTIKTLIRWLQEKRLNKNEMSLLGAHLYSALLDNDIGRILDEHRNVTEEFIRIDLAFEDPEDEVATWPYEYLYRFTSDGGAGYFIANEARFAITRRPGVRPSRPVQVKGGETVRVLFVAASPCDLVRVEFDKLLAAIERLQWVDQEDHTKGRRFELLEPLITQFVSKEDLIGQRGPQDAKATWDGFKQMLEELERDSRSPHIIHFVGHGECSSRVGQIAFVAPNYQKKWVTGQELAGVLQPCDSVKLVFLQACESAMPAQDIYSPMQALSDVARCLASVSIPAVVAMQSKVEVFTANVFAETFYKSLVEMMPVYQAVQNGRRQISDIEALGIPVLYLLRHGDEVGVLFSAAEPTRPINRTDAPGRIACAWCGRLSRSGTRCSFKECRAQLRCPGCSQFVQIQSEGLLDKREVYECQCGKAFGIDGVMEGVVERLPTGQLQGNDVFETKPTAKAFQ